MGKDKTRDGRESGPMSTRWVVDSNGDLLFCCEDMKHGGGLTMVFGDSKAAWLWLAGVTEDLQGLEA